MADYPSLHNFFLVRAPCRQSLVASPAVGVPPPTLTEFLPASISPRTSRSFRLGPPREYHRQNGASPSAETVAKPTSWSWEEFLALPSETFTVDIHCVTKWSKLDTRWAGVSIDTLLEQVGASGKYVMAWSEGGYTTNLPSGRSHRRQGVDCPHL